MAAPTSLTFADLLRYHRMAAGLTQEELAARAHLSVDAISTLERGVRRSPRKDTVALLAEALAVSPEDRAALVAAARRLPTAALAATPPDSSAQDGHAPSSPISAVGLPHGTVTFLFADIEGSTHLLKQLGERYGELLSTLQMLLHSVCVAHHGHELGTQGDRFFIVFAHPDDAVAAAVEAQQTLAAHVWPEGEQMRLRIGVHTGSALLTAGRYVGLEVARAANVSAAGHGGQVLVSQAVVDEMAKRGQGFPPGTQLRYLGMHRLGTIRQRESVSQLVLPDTPNLPTQFPPLRTLDLWPIMRARLLAGAVLTLTLLAVGGLLLPLVVPSFPRALGQVAGLADLLLVAGLVVAPMRRPQLRRQWREMRQPVVALTSVLLTLVVLLTMLFATKPFVLTASHPPRGYDFSYSYHRPTHFGGSITIGLAEPIETLAINGFGNSNLLILSPIWQSCIVQLPDQTLGLTGGGWKPDQCTEVPTVDNGGESADGRTTIFHIDPRAVWSDGVPITAEDFLFSGRLGADPNIIGAYPIHPVTLTALNSHTIQMRWAEPYADYLAALRNFQPLPLHIYARGKFAGVYDPATGAYNSALAQQLRNTPAFNTTIPVDNGSFTIQPSSFIPNHRVVLLKNPRFFSNFFHMPALDQITLVSAFGDFQQDLAAGRNPSAMMMEADVIDQYRRGLLALAMPLEPLNLSQLAGIPKDQLIISPSPSLTILGFNQRTEAPNAQANGGVSIFTDRRVRQAFIEAFDRCAAMRALLGEVTCGDPNLFTDESDAVASDVIYDPTFRLPGYNPPDAAHLMDKAGYLVVDGVRRNKDGVTPLKITLAATPSTSNYAGILNQLQQDYTRNLHIEVTIIKVTNLWGVPDGIGLSGKFDVMMGASIDQSDPVERLTIDWGPFNSDDIVSPENPSGWNPFGIIDRQASQREQLAVQTPSDEQRTVILRSLQRYFSQQFYIEPIFVRADITLAEPTLCNFKHWPQFGFDLWNMADWYIASGAQGCP